MFEIAYVKPPPTKPATLPSAMSVIGNAFDSVQRTRAYPGGVSTGPLTNKYEHALKHDSTATTTTFT